MRKIHVLALVWGISRAAGANGSTRAAELLPLAFAPGSPGASTRYTANGARHAVQITDAGAYVVLEKAVLPIHVAGARRESRPVARQALPGKANFFLGQDRAQWRSNVPTFAKIEFPEVLEGVDIVYYGSGRKLEYDLEVSPGADPARIEMEIGVGWKAAIGKDGSMRVEDASGAAVEFAKPVSYQSVGGLRVPVESAYELRGECRFGFRVGKYDRSLELVIDPVVVYGTYLGGTERDEARAVAVDASGNAYLTGTTVSASFPTTNGAAQTQCSYPPASSAPCVTTFNTGGLALTQHAFVTKFNSAGTQVLYSTFLGGPSRWAADPGTTGASAIAVDSAGNAHVAGATLTDGYPTTAGAFQTGKTKRLSCANSTVVDTPDQSEAFYTKLNAAGGLLYSTYLGGSFHETATGIALAPGGDVYVVGSTNSSNGSNACTGNHGAAWFPYPGITGTGGGAAVLQGQEPPLTVVNGANIYHNEGVERGFVTRINSAGALVWGAYISAPCTPLAQCSPGGHTTARSVAVDAAGTVYVAGDTGNHRLGCTNCTLTPQSGAGVHFDPFVMKISAAGSMQYMRVFGGIGHDYGFGLAVDSAGNAYVAGTSYPERNTQAEPAFPTTAGAYRVSPRPIEPQNNRPFEAGFVTKLSPSGTTLYSTLVTSSTGRPVDIRGIAVHDPSRTAIVTGRAQNLAAVNSLRALSSESEPFVARLNAAGSALLVQSPLSAVCCDFFAIGNAIAADANLNAWIVGSAPNGSSTLDTPGAYRSAAVGADAFAVKINLTVPEDSQPAFIAPANNSTVTTTIVSFQWTPVSSANRYELRVIEASTPQQFRVEVLGSTSTNAIYTLPSGNYRAEVRACDATGCGPAGITNFVINGGQVPAAAPTGVNCTVANTPGNRLSCNWTALAGAHFYFVNVVQPGAGPGGGALTVAGLQAGTNSISIQLPNGAATVLIRGCTGDGCGPFSAGFNVNPNSGNPTVPILAEPFAGSSIDSGANAPQITFAWNRVAGDNGSNYKYRLYVQDFSRNAPALDVLTTNNFYGAFVNPGTRFDALVIAIPNSGGPQQQGPPSAFLTRGRVPKSPVVTAPAFGSTVTRDSQGRVQVAWTPLVNSDGTVSVRKYQYFFAGPTQVAGVATETSAFPILGPGNWQGIVRACTTGTACVESSAAGWGPWNNEVGSEGGMASFTVQ